MAKLRVDVWSDLACPWCYVGKRRLEAAMQEVAERGSIEVVWRAFELNPQAPRVVEQTVPYAQRLAWKYGTSPEQAQVMVDRMTRTAAGDGLTFDFDRVRPTNTFDAHRLVAFARERGVQGAMKERLLRAYMTEGELISDHDVLVRLATDAMLATDETRAMLASDRFADEVRADEAEARAIGITGVPFFVLGGRLAVSGAQPANVLAGALAQGWDLVEEEGVVAAGAPDGAVCGPDGC